MSAKSNSSKYKELTVRLKGYVEQESESSSDEDEEIEVERVSELRSRPDTPAKEPTPTPPPTPKPVTPAPAPKIEDSRITLNLSSDNEASKKLRLQRTNVISFVNDLIFLLENNAKNSDVEFIIRRKDGDAEIPSKIKPQYAFHLHSLILSARSAFCKGKLERREHNSGRLGNTRLEYRYFWDGAKHVFELNNINVDAFQEFVKFLYIAQCNVNSTNFITLINLARGFGVKCLEDLVCRYIKNKLEVYRGDKTYRLNELIHLAQVSYDFKLETFGIRETCVELLSRVRGEVIQTEAWDHLASNYPKLVSDMLTK